MNRNISGCFNFLQATFVMPCRLKDFFKGFPGPSLDRVWITILGALLEFV